MAGNGNYFHLVKLIYSTGVYANDQIQIWYAD
jgi:hypothetical protein